MSRALKSPSARLSERLRLTLGAAALMLAVWGSAGMLGAQSLPRMTVESPVLTIDSERLFEDSDFGRRTLEEIESLGAALAAENRRIEEDLTQEEKSLTELRQTTSPEEFRALADAFDAKVQETRRTQEAKSRDLNVKLENRRVMFLNAAAPVLEQLMREAGAAVVLERRSIFISSNAVDITQIAIERLNLALDDQDIPAAPD